MFVDNLYIGLGCDLELDLVVNSGDLKLNDDESFIFIRKNDNFLGEKMLKYILNEDWNNLYKFILWVYEGSKNDFIDNKNIIINLYNESIEELYKFK